MTETATKELKDADISDINEKVYAKLGICGKINDIIGTQIFGILKLYARVIFYPLGENAPWGFTRIKGKDSTSSSSPFVAINTSIPKDCQVFAAAHELYHIWYDPTLNMIPSNVLKNGDVSYNERKANRFAAEFLIEEKLLKQELFVRGINVDKVGIKDVLCLSDLFTVPYVAMVKRLNEIHFLSDDMKEELLAIEDKHLKKFRKRYSFSEPEADGRVVMDNLTDLSAEAYEKGYITFERLEYLLSLCDTSPEEIGLSAPQQFDPPSDEELDELLGEQDA